ncbi:MaoC family dehydratase [Fictibacillus barbaricus]|uniref:Acyl dehydratase n=1 Tax=Fictibacillus barbaricus TaxID=182136 RepID=A0ABU1U1P4_9BACL|nr:MaoC/PaaZ C-terminal domain-containing protein [Fictibacillus barbaricus]MDR7073410.1 acyl dehydratase [Fictibacillus barbaricus]
MELLKAGSALEPLHFSEIKKEMVEDYAKVSGDYNPIHLDQIAAQKVGFQSPIIHGMLSMGLAAQIVEPLLRVGYWVKQYETTFRAPVFTGEALTIHGTIANVENDLLTIDIIAKSSSNDRILTGNIILKKL